MPIFDCYETPEFPSCDKENILNFIDQNLALDRELHSDPEDTDLCYIVIFEITNKEILLLENYMFPAIETP